MNDPIVTVAAPAKLNLYLHVTGKRDDGYHLLDSLIAFADIGDEIKARAARLRAVGDAAQTAWLDSRIGATERLVMETETRGRGESFAEVELASPREPGALVETRITGRDGAKLRAA
mgnify:CR=1 FL=1